MAARWSPADLNAEYEAEWWDRYQRDHADEPCRTCRGRGYDRRDPDEPCSHCDGEGVEPAW